MSDEEKTLFDPCLRASRKILKYSFTFFCEIFEVVSKPLCSLPHAEVFFCGFCLVLVPLVTAYWLLVLGLLLAELLLLLSLGFLLGLLFVLLGVWPAPIIALGLTAISLVRLPFNLFYQTAVTCRTALLRTNLKILSFLLLPVIHMLVPVVTLVVSLLYFSVKYSFVSFIGFPGSNWRNIRKNLEIGWQKFATDMEGFYSNYGHQSGIPVNWDGRVYGLPVDPVIVLIALLVYLVILLPLSLAVMFIFLLKCVPIFLGTLTQFWASFNLSASLSWYRRVLTGSQAPPRPSAEASQTDQARSGHDGWIRSLKRSTKSLVKFIENYAKIRPLEAYERKLRGYAGWVKCLKCLKPDKVISAYWRDLSPTRLLPDNLGWSLLCLWLPLLLTCLMWLLGLTLVLTVPPATLLLGLLLWLAGWLLVLPLWPLLYLAGWLFILFCLPSLYLLVWVAIMICPWLLSALGALSGPLLALRVPIFIISANFYNPLELGASLAASVRLCPAILRILDRWTGSLALGGWRLTRAEADPALLEPKKAEPLKYWPLVVERGRAARAEIVGQGWLQDEDIASASAVSMIAVPGVAVLALLIDSLGSAGLAWSPTVTCSQSNRDPHDNVASLFWPQLMEVRGLLSRLEPALLPQAAAFISASLCDGEDERSPSLAAVLERKDQDQERHRPEWLKIRAKLENITHSLLRVQEFNQNLQLIIADQGGK